MEHQNETVNSVSRREARTPGIDKDLERGAEQTIVGAGLALPKRRAASSAPTGSVRRTSFPPYIRAAQQRQGGFTKAQWGWKVANGCRANPFLRYHPCDDKCRGRGEAADQHGLQRTSCRRRSREAAFQVAEGSQRYEGDHHGEHQRGLRGGEHNVRPQRDETPGDVGAADRERAGEGALRIGLLEAQLKSHHEIDPRVWALAQRLNDGRALLVRQAIGPKHLHHLHCLLRGFLAHFQLLTRPLGCVVLRVVSGREVAAQAHGDRTRCDLSQARGDNDTGRGHGAGQPRRERKGYGQAIRHPDDDVSDNLASGEVLFDVRYTWHRSPPKQRWHLTWP